MKLKWKVMAPSTTPAAARSCHQFISWHHGFNKPPQIFRVSQDQHSHYFFPDYPPPHLPWFGLSGSCNLINRMGVAKKKPAKCILELPQGWEQSESRSLLDSSRWLGTACLFWGSSTRLLRTLGTFLKDPRVAVMSGEADWTRSMLGQKQALSGTKIPQCLGLNENNIMIKISSLMVVISVD